MHESAVDRTCATCGVSIVHLFNLRKYCDEHTPRTNTKGRTPCPKCGELSWSKKRACRPCSGVAKRQCFKCGKPGNAGICSSCHWRDKAPEECATCGRSRKILAKQMCASCYSVAYRRANPVDGTCTVCGQDFRGRKGQRLCGLTCQRKAALGVDTSSPRAREPRKSKVRRKAERAARKASEGTTGGRRVWVQGNCCMCGTGFVSPGDQSRYCSRECRTRNRNRAHGLTLLDRMAIFERDGWACQICYEPVNWNAHHLSDWYPTLDHILPQSLGGSHEESNLRTAHRWCNSVRGNLAFYTDADLRA